jgi:hypothetical protein
MVRPKGRGLTALLLNPIDKVSILSRISIGKDVRDGSLEVYGSTVRVLPFSSIFLLNRREIDQADAIIARTACTNKRANVPLPSE